MTAPARPLSRNGFEVAILCALRLEADAVEGVFDGHWGDADLYGRAAGDYNNYAVGKVGEHNVVLTVMPGMGKATAASVATRLRSSFPCIKLALLVGVCGGVPFTSDGVELVLGDVVVSTGVVQFDFGRQYPNKAVAKDTPRDNLSRPNAEIRTFLAEISGLRAKSLLKNSTSYHLAALLRRHQFVSWKYPGSREDKLYEATYRHKHHDSTTCPTCAQCQSQYDDVCNVAPKVSCKMLQCNPARLVSRDRLKVSQTNEAEEQGQAVENSFAPAILFGLVASGDLVMKSGQHRDEIAHEKDVIAFEMEGAGVWDNLPTIIVKGICDYADSHKSKNWQNYAAATAAACMKALLEKWRATCSSSSTSTETELIVYDPQSQPTVPHSLIPREAWPLDSSGRGQWPQLVSRISDYDYAKAHRRLRSKRLPGTGEWFLSHPNLETWRQNAAKSTLWFSGKVGSGKTMICPSEPRTTEAKYLVESMIKQLLDHMANLQTPCSEELKRGIKRFYTPAGPEPDLEDLFEIFNVACVSFSPVWFVIDGLDELLSDEISQLLSHFRNLFLPGTDRKLLIASRDDLGPNVRISLELRIQLLQSDTTDDIRRFVNAEMSRKTEHERVLTASTNVLETMKSQLCEKAGGMFLWVRLQIEALWLDCHSNDDIRSALDNLPVDLNATYERCIKRIPASIRDLALKVLRWVICSNRPLQMYELQEAVGFTLDDHEWNIDKCPLQSTIMSSCGNLIELDPLDQTIRIIHNSVKQYLCGLGKTLQGHFQSQLEKATLECGEECVNYLSFSNFGLQLQKKPEVGIVASVPARIAPSLVLSSLPFPKVTGRVSNFFNTAAAPRQINVRDSRPPQQPTDAATYAKYGLLDYARQNWTIHTRELPQSSKMWHRFETLALQPNITWNLQPWNPSGQSAVSHLHALLSYSARENHIALLRVVLDRGRNYAIKDFCNLPLAEDGLPALHAAARLGHTEIIRLLLRICKVNVIDSGGRTALHYAAEKNHIGVAEQLLFARGILTNVVAQDNETPIYIAARSGSADMISRLLTAGVVLPKDNRREDHALVVAAELGHSHVLSLLTGANVKLGKWAVHDAIVGAAENGHADAVRVFLVRTRYTEETLRIALERSIRGGHSKVLDILLSRSAIDVNSALYDGKSVLHVAVRYGQEEIVRSLLKRQDVEVNSPDEDQNTPLVWAMSNLVYPHLSLLNPPLVEPSVQEIEGVIGALLESSKIDVNARDKTGQPALLLAVMSESLQAVWLLLKRPELDVNLSPSLPGCLSDTPLMVAARKGEEEIVALLTERDDLNVNLSSADGETALMRAVARGHIGIIRLLINNADIHVNQKNRSEQTALMLAVGDGNVEAVNQLLEHQDVDVNSKDRHLRTPLMHALICGHLEVVKQLLERPDTDINSKDDAGETTLMRAAIAGRTDAVRLLLERPDVDINLKYDGGMTLLMRAAGTGWADVVRLLLERASIDVNCKSDSERTALFYAAELGHEEIIRQLLALRMVDVNCQCEKGHTPLHTAVRNGHKDVVSLLLQRTDLDLALKDSYGWTAIHHAYRSNSSATFPVTVTTREEIILLFENEIEERKALWKS